MKLFSRNNKGLTLTELMVSIVIMMIISITLSAIFLNSQKSFMHLNSRMVARQEASYVVRMIERELRQTSQGSDDLESIDIADSNHISFYADLDNNDKPEKIDYALNAESIIKTVTQASNNAAPWVFNGSVSTKTITANSTNSSLNPIFVYYSNVDQTLGSLPLNTTDRALIKLINIKIGVLMPDGVKTDSYQSEIFLRNKNEAM